MDTEIPGHFTKAHKLSQQITCSNLCQALYIYIRKAKFTSFGLESEPWKSMHVCTSFLQRLLIPRIIHNYFPLLHHLRLGRALWVNRSTTTDWGLWNLTNALWKEVRRENIAKLKIHFSLTKLPNLWIISCSCHPYQTDLLHYTWNM